jgi:hypothetical protein
LPRLTAAAAIALSLASIPEPAAQELPARPKPPAIAPLPPVRPANLGGPPNAGGPAPPATPQSLPPAAPPAAPASGLASPAEKAADGPRPLPAASRQRMHACGLEWQDMKIAGQARDKTWREFAEVCLSR